MEQIGLSGWQDKEDEDINLAVMSIIYKAAKVASEYNQQHRVMCRKAYSQDATERLEVFFHTMYKIETEYRSMRATYPTDKVCIAIARMAKNINEAIHIAGSKVVHLIHLLKFQHLLHDTFGELIRKDQTVPGSGSFEVWNIQNL